MLSFSYSTAVLDEYRMGPIASSFGNCLWQVPSLKQVEALWGHPFMTSTKTSKFFDPPPPPPPTPSVHNRPI